MENENDEKSFFDDLDYRLRNSNGSGEVIWDIVAQLWPEAKSRIFKSWLVESAKIGIISALVSAQRKVAI